MTTVQLKSGGVEMSDGSLYVPNPIKDARGGMSAALHILLKHTADMFVTVVDIIAETHGLDKDEMMNVVREHPRFAEMFVSPVLHDLAYVERPAAAAAAAAVPEPLADIEDIAGKAPAPEEAAPKKRGWSEEAKASAAAKRAATKAAKAAAAAPPPAEPEPVPEPPAPQPKKVVFKIKPKAAAAAAAAAAEPSSS